MRSPAARTCEALMEGEAKAARTQRGITKWWPQVAVMEINGVPTSENASRHTSAKLIVTLRVRFYN